MGKEREFCEIAKATRRIIYNVSDEGIAERGFFRSDFMSGVGSGLLVYMDFRFFLLTARHNLDRMYPEEMRNESHVWVPKEFSPKFSGLQDFLMARRVWYIGELIDDERETFDPKDVVLVEFFPPVGPQDLPENFVRVSGDDDFLKEEEFYEGQILSCFGYPESSNYYDNIEGDPIYNQSTAFNLSVVVGSFTGDAVGGTMVVDEPHNEVNGMSGGGVFFLGGDVGEGELAGIVSCGGGGFIRFVPAFMFNGALLRYRDARCEVIDQASNLTEYATERYDSWLKILCEMAGKDEDYKRNLGLFTPQD